MSIFDSMTEEQEVAFLRQILDNMDAMKTASATSSVPQKAPPPEAVERLKEKIDDKGRWTGGTNSDGYPKVKINGESELASHVLLKAEGRSLRPGQVVMHKDNDKLDLRPGNLRIGTQAGNLKQMRDEGRDRPRGVAQEPDVKKAESLKLGKLKTELLPHQQRVVDRMEHPDQKGLVVIHGLGSGKTLTSIATQDALKSPASVVVPAALQENYRKEQAKHLSGKPEKTDLLTLQRVAREGGAPNNPLLIVDEAHRLRDAGSSSYGALKDNEASKRLLLTGSPFYNHPSDIAALINLAANESVLPTDKQQFESKYIGIKKISPGFIQQHLMGVQPGEVPVLNQGKAEELRGIFAKHTDFHPGSTDNFPSVEHRDVVVPMSKKQKEVYDTLMGEAPSWVSAKVRKGLPPSKQEMSSLGAFLTGPRQAVNSTAPYVKDPSAHEAPKVQKAFENLQAMLKENPEGKAVIYSNYLDAGIAPYREQLSKAGIPFGEFTGQLKPRERDETVRQYNEGKLRALLLSSAGGEGLDLKGTRLVQLLEPHWNSEKLKQVEGRAARYGSHAHLPPEQQKVLVERYLAGVDPGFVGRLTQKMLGTKPDQTVDQYLAMMSSDKDNLNQQFRDLLPKHPAPSTKTGAADYEDTEESEEMEMRKKADELDRKYVEGLRPDFLRAPGVTRYQLQAMGKRLGMDPLAAYQISGMDAAAKGLPITHAVHQQAMAMGIPYPHHLGSAGRQPLSQLGDDVLEGLEKTKPAAPPALPAPTSPQAPRPRTGFTTPIQPSPAVAGLSAPRPQTPVPQVPRPKLVAPKVSLAKPMMAAAMKLAANAAARHIRAAMQAGDIDLANQIGGGMAKLEMKPRFIKGLGAGAEAQADLMAGKSELGAEGLHVRKLYRPDSFVSQGEETGQLLAEKKRITDIARDLSPEAKEMVPAFHGVRRHDNGGVPMFSSDHEYVHGLKPATSNPIGAVLNAKDLERAVVEPLKARGIHIDDIPLPSQQGGALSPRHDNYSNFPIAPDGSGRMIDFLPTSGSGANMSSHPPPGQVHMDGGAVIPHHPVLADSPIKGDALRKAVYKGMPAAPAPKGRLAGALAMAALPVAAGGLAYAASRARRAPEEELDKAAEEVFSKLPASLRVEVLSVLGG